MTEHNTDPEAFTDEFALVQTVDWEDVDAAVQIGVKPATALLLIMDGDYHACWWDSTEDTWGPPRELDDDAIITAVGDADFTPLIDELTTN